jgi:RimJ/RimL family protein N-acetyltransferase
MDIPPDEIVTERLRLRRPALADAAAMFSTWAQDPEVTRYLAWSPHKDISESEAHIQRSIEAWNSGASFVWLIEHQETQRLAGSIAARNQEHGINIGYVLARGFWGRGLMAEAVNAVAAWFIEQPGVERIWATCDVDNVASARVLNKAGFQFEGILRRWDIHPNVSTRRRDARCYSRIE